MYTRLYLLFAALLLSTSLVAANSSPTPPYNVREEIVLPKPENYNVHSVDMSADARYILYEMTEINDGYPEKVSVYDRKDGTHVSLTDQITAHLNIESILISADGRYAALTAQDHDFGDGPVYGYLFDLQTGTHIEVIKGLNGEPLQALKSGVRFRDISADGRYIVYQVSTQNAFDGQYATCRTKLTCSAIFLYDRDPGITERISANERGELANGQSYGGYVSGNGRFVAFNSWATNLGINDPECFPGDYCVRLFQYDRYLRKMKVFRTNIDAQTPARYLDGTQSEISYDGNQVVFGAYRLSDNQPHLHVFSFNWLTKQLDQLSVSTLGTQSTRNSEFIRMSPDARYVLFITEDHRAMTDNPNDCQPTSTKSCFPALFLRDTVTRTTHLVSQKDGVVFYAYPIPFYPAISSAGDQILIRGSINGGGDVSISTPVNVTLPRPSNITPGTSPTQINLTWTDNTNGAAVYQIERSPNGIVDWKPLHTTAAGATSYSDVNPPCGTVYYRLRAFDGINNLYSPYSFNVDAQACEPLPQLVQNGGFEDAGETWATALYWNGKGLDNDKRVQNKPDKQLSHSGGYAFQFKASPGIQSKIVQSISSPVGESGQFLKLSAWVEGKNLSGAKIQAKIIYNDQPAQKLVLDSAALNAGSYPYKLLSVEDTLNGTISSIKVQISQKNGTGHLRIDDVSLVLSATASNTLIALP